MNYTIIKDIAHQAISERIGFVEWETFETVDDVPVVLGFLTPEDSSAGFLEIRYTASCDDGGTIRNLSGIKRAPFSKSAGVVTLGTVTDEYLSAGTGIMATSALDILADGGNINVQGTGALAFVSWDVVTFLNSAPALSTL